MAPDPCQVVQDQLSAFFDDELGVAERLQVEEHLAKCPRCQSELAGFGRVSDLFQQTEDKPIPHRWASIERSLGPPRSKVAAWWWSRSGGIAAAVAAALAIAVGFWANSDSRDLLAQRDTGDSQQEVMAGMKMDPEHMRDFQNVISEYLVKLSADPEQAEDYLLANYEGQRIAPDQAQKLVGYSPLISQGMPEGYELTSSSVVKMPCCTCFKATCRRSDGSTLVLFEHDDEMVAWFGDRKSVMATCGNKDCCLVELDSSIAATWKEGSRSITAVGARDENEVAMLVKALKQS